MKSKRLRAYLSGGMEYAKGEGADWRREFEQWLKSSLGHSVFNPNSESERYLAKKYPGDNFRSLKEKDVESFTRIVRGIVDLDSTEIAKRSDYVVCYWDESALRGAGTKGELTIARFFRKPVYMVTSFDPEDLPGWILGCTTKRFKSFDELRSYLVMSYSVTSRKMMK